MTNQKGLAPLLIVLLIAAAIGGYLIYTNYSQYRTKVTSSPILQLITQQTPQSSSAPADQNQTSDTLSEINGFPVYPNSVFIKKDNYPPCKDGQYSGYSLCNENTYTWQTKDNFDIVNAYYEQDKANSGWKCSGGAGSYGGSRDATSTTTCNKDSFHYGLDLRSNSQKTEIILGIPLGGPTGVPLK